MAVIEWHPAVEDHFVELTMSESRRPQNRIEAAIAT
jgi:hypothetical protein